jgi:hypothetical protein
MDGMVSDEKHSVALSPPGMRSPDAVNEKEIRRK